MKIFCLVAALLGMTGCTHGGFLTAGAHYAWPAADESSGFSAAGGTIGGGVSLSGVSLSGEKTQADPDAPYLEAWGSYMPDVDDIEVTMGGVGLRTRSHDVYFRVGALYQRPESGSDFLGGYVGLGRDIFLDEARTLSLAPEVLVGGLFGDDALGRSDANLYAAAGVSLNWYFGGGSRNKKK